MPKQKISEFNSNPALNTDIDSINIAEGCAPSGINDAIRELMSQLKDWQSGTSNDPYVVGSSGSLTLNQGTANGVAYLNGSKVVTSGSALTFSGSALGVNATSTDASMSIQALTANYASVLSLVANNDNGAQYNNISSSTSGGTVHWRIGGVAGTSQLPFSVGGSEGMRLTSTGLGIGTSSPSAKLHVTSSGRDVAIIESTDAGALNGPYLNLYRNSASPAASDYLGFLQFSGKNSSGSAVDYAFIGTQATQVTTSPAQKGDLVFFTANEASPSEKLRLDSSGNLGLGVTPSAWSTSKAIQVGSTAALFSYNNATTDVGSNVYYDGASYKYITTNSASFARQTSGGHSWYTAASGTAGNAITFTQAMTLTASSELLVNRTSASGLGKLNVEGGADFTAGNVLIGRDSGNLLVGTTATVNAAKSVFSFSSSSNGVYLIDSTGVSGAQFMRFDSTSNTCGSITRVAATSAVTYNTTSDYRLKEVICAVSDSGSRIDALHPIEYTWKSDGTRTRGFLAHQFQEVYANSVTGTKDAVDADGNPEYQSMQAGSAEVIADLVAEIQSLRKRLADAGL